MSKGKKTELIIVISILSVLIIALMIFASYFLITRGTNQTGQNVNPPVVNITSCPQQVTSDNPNVIIEGVMISDAPYCNLTINGEVVATSTGKGMQVQWSKNYVLTAGETREFNIEAKDSNNLVTVQKKTVYCQELNTKKNRAPISPGCTLVKKKANGLNIREYAGTDYAIVDYIHGSDYTSEMVFTGHYEVDYQGYTWYEVVSPKGKHGYVRSDLVQTNTFVD
ncbi:MAG: SH3 domain-containing protein [Clostridia bacterium]|nr:SH3 domain-containing protein [Clostridia bacterium]